MQKVFTDSFVDCLQAVMLSDNYSAADQLELSKSLVRALFVDGIVQYLVHPQIYKDLVEQYNQWQMLP